MCVCACMLLDLLNVFINLDLLFKVLFIENFKQFILVILTPFSQLPQNLPCPLLSSVCADLLLLGMEPFLACD